jgi:hypothetical protein
MANIGNILQNANTIMGSMNISKEFQDLLRQISEAQTKQVLFFCLSICFLSLSFFCALDCHLICVFVHWVLGGRALYCGGKESSQAKDRTAKHFIGKHENRERKPRKTNKRKLEDESE